MQWYVLKTEVGKEDRALLLLSCLFNDVKVILPKRKLSWRKKGKVIDVIKPLFNGYLFVSADDMRISEVSLWLRNHKMGVWFITFGGSIIPVNQKEMLLIQQLISNGGIVEPSVIMQNGHNVKIVSGPLVGLEGLIQKYCKRDRRVIIKITIGSEEKLVELEGTWVRAFQSFK
jgi:transcriptional antiterminator NusG